MKNFIKLFMIIAIVAFIGFSFITCNDEDTPTKDPAKKDLTGTISISAGSAVVNSKLTAIWTKGTGDPDTITYQWNKDGTALAGINTVEYTPTQTGDYTVTVSALGFNSKTSAPVTIGNAPLAGTITITPAGSVEVDTELTATWTAGANDPGSVVLQWNRGGIAIPNEIGLTYTPTQNGSYTVTVSAAGFGSKTSNTVTVAPSLSGTLTITPANPNAGDELTAAYDGPESGITFQWRRINTDTEPLVGTSNTYTPYAGGTYVAIASAAGSASKRTTVIVSGPNGTINQPIPIKLGAVDYFTTADAHQALTSFIGARTLGVPSAYYNLDFTDAIGITDWGVNSIPDGVKPFIIDLILPDVVTKIVSNVTGRHTFSGESPIQDYYHLRSFLARNVIETEVNPFNRTPAIYIDMPKLETLGTFAFYNYRGGFTLNIPSIKTIGRRAFQHLWELVPGTGEYGTLGSNLPVTIIMGATAPVISNAGGLPELFTENNGRLVTIKIPNGATGYTPVSPFDGETVSFGSTHGMEAEASWLGSFRGRNRPEAGGGAVIITDRVITFVLDNDN